MSRGESHPTNMGRVEKYEAPPKIELSRQETPNSVGGAKRSWICFNVDDDGNVVDDDDDDGGGGGDNDDDDGGGGGGEEEEEEEDEDEDERKMMMSMLRRRKMMKLRREDVEDISQEPFWMEIYGENAGRFQYHLD